MEKACFTYANRDLIEGIKSLARKLGRTPLRREIDADGACPSTWVYYKRFGSLRRAYLKAGLKPSKITKAEAMKA